MIRPFFVALSTTLLLSPLVNAQESDTSAVSADTEGPIKPRGNEGPPTEGAATDLQSIDDAPNPNHTPAHKQALSQEAFDDLQSRVDLMEEDIERLIGEQDKLNQKSALDRLNWFGGYQTVFNIYYLDHFQEERQLTHLVMATDDRGIPIMDNSNQPVLKKRRTTPRDERKDWLAPTWTHRIKLSMAYEFGESLRFFAQLGVYKYFNETKNTIGTIDHGSNAYPRDNAFRLERVYIDFFVTKWLAISIGRIASPNGPPTELKQNSDRRSGWGVQMMNATIDTIMTTFYLGKSHYLRLFYSPFGAHPSYAVNSDVSLFDDQKNKLLHAWGGILELAMPGQESIFQAGFFHVPRFTPPDSRIQFPGSYMAVPQSESDAENLGTYLAANTLILLKDLLDSGLDLFAAYGLTLLQPTEDRMIFEAPYRLPVRDPSGEETGQLVERAEKFKIGLASSEEDSKTNLGHTIYAGARYTIPINDKYPSRIGAEFNWGTKYHQAWSHPNEQLVDKLGNKGWTVEGYFIQQIVPKHLFLRLGYLELQRNFAGQIIGPTRKLDQRIRNIYFLVNLDW